MIQQLSNKYRQATATLLFTLCYNTMILPAHAFTRAEKNNLPQYSYKSTRNLFRKINTVNAPGIKNLNLTDSALANAGSKKTGVGFRKINQTDIGGPSQPEMSAFKSVGTNNMVNLFTGDFSYNIHLLDVGGYPVNIFYNAGVSMEDEASWVGLGWNINPGNVNRNMRGVPDDFNGEDVIKQTQTIKPNVTWGVNLGADLEVVGLKALPVFSGSVGGSLGVSFNNYLGPALDIGVRGNTSLSIGAKTLAEKSALTLGGSLSINASSRNGVTFSPGISLTANVAKVNDNARLGLGLKASTSYNSRSGIKALQISEQMSFSKSEGTNHKGETKDISRNSVGANIFSSSISFNKPSYIPAMRLSMTNTAFSGHFQLGGAIFGVYPSFEVEVYKQKSEVAKEDVIQIKPMVGYLYLQKAVNNANAVMDFTRVNDNEVTPSTPIISAPQYTYDVFSIQGEGTGGSIRAYRNDEGYVRDNQTTSKDKNISGGADVGIPGHYGANFSTIKTPSTIGEWKEGNKLRSLTQFKEADGSLENVYFRNPGENSVLNSNQYDRIGGTSLVRYKLDGTNMSPTLEPVLEKFSKLGIADGIVNIPGNAPVTERKKRSQVTSFLTAEEASVIGLDKQIKSYDGTNIIDHDTLKYQSYPRYENTVRKKHHISQINVTEASGQRYIYGIPVYNLKQKDFTFTVTNAESVTDPDKVDFTTTEALNLNTGDKDGYLQITETPAFAHSFLLSGLLSPDYVDVSGDGITEDDLGSAVKFNYSRMAGVSKWRTPLTSTPKANFNAGKRSEDKDDKGIVSYGERESWYMHSIESKTMIALFKLENRNDSKGSGGNVLPADDELKGININDNSAQRLKQIDLYSKADLKKNGIAGAKPIKTVHFEYSYSLCKGTASKPMPTNPTTGEGKLTLEKIWFSFNGQTRANKNQYLFSYGSTTADNPNYDFNASDRWGTYKPSSANPQALKNSDYPYSIQDKNLKTTIDENASAWLLKKILLPSGGQMEVTYESDDYAFVQNKRAAVMMQVAGFGNAATAFSNQLYNVNGNGITENNYVFITLPEACSTKAEFFEKYLKGIDQLSFKLAVNMKKGMEFLHSYATMDNSDPDNYYDFYTADASNKTFWIKLKLVDGLNPLSLTAIEFLREQLPGQAFRGYDVSESDGLQKVGDLLAGLFDGLNGAFKNPVNHLRQQGLAQTVDVSKCFVRLNDPDGFKYGGGHRVKSVRLKDNWSEMNSGQLYTSEYGQDYDYTTTEIFNGKERTISSGVASYEPSLGGDENPFQTMLQISNKVPLGPASYGSVEMPILDAFFPSASVGYSKVTVKSIKKNTDPSKKSRSGIGKQVTEYYTAKDFPVYYSHTVLDPGTDKQASVSSFGLFFFKYAYDSRTLSQGFLVETNDMHGKLKSQASYPENDDKTPINFTQNFYKNTGTNGLDEKFNFVYAAEGGTIRKGNMGIDIELMTDTRQFSVNSYSFEIQGQVDLFPILFPFWLPFIWPVYGENKNIYRAVTATKVVSYHSILDRVVVIDKGSEVSTENILYDAETGEVIVNKTNNEYKKPIYSTNYPAWWAYSGMGPAYKNIDAVYSGVNFFDGRIVSGNVPNNIFESGDELFVTNSGSSAGCDAVMASPADKMLVWAFDIAKNNNSLTNTNPAFIFLDAKGKPYSRTGVSFRIVRSGKRNNLSAGVSSAVSMLYPIVNNKLALGIASDVVNATAVEYKEKWQTDNDVIKKLIQVTNPVTCTISEVEDCNGYLEKSINPYVKGLLGTFRSKQSRVFYNGRKENDPAIATNIAANGFLNDFKLYWDFNIANNLVPDELAATSKKWVVQNEVTKLNSKGLELETKDALNIYTAAQYGFNKTSPVAIANNSRYNEMFAEGFEDDSYNEKLNLTSNNICAKKHIDFNGIANASIVTSNAELKAHSGNRMLMVNGSSTAVKNVNVSNNIIENYDLNITNSVISNLLNPGVSSHIVNTTNDPNNISTCYYIFYSPAPYTPNYHELFIPYNGYYSTTQPYLCDGSLEMIGYIKPTVNTCYKFGPNISTLNSYPSPSSFGSGSFNIQFCDGTNIVFSNFRLRIYKNGNPFYDKTFYGYNSDGNLPLIPQLSLDPAVYKIQTNFSYHYSGATSNGCPNYCPPYQSGYCPPSYYGQSPTGIISANNKIDISLLNTLNNSIIDSYRDLDQANVCTYSNPIPASDNMINPLFSLASYKKMLFSAWVKEDCTSPCYKTDYTNSNIEIWSGGVNIGATAGINGVKRVGNIIEGWQKIEGEFTVPENVSTTEIRFINSNPAAPMYVDDIRIHPYNANMKSYVYDPVNLRLVAELDANNYATFYEYDDEGTLIRTKVETREGIKTVTETRSAKQKNINTFQ